MALLNWDQGSAGDKTQRGVVWVSYLLILGMFVCSVVLARSVPASAEASGAGVGLTAFLLFAAAAAVGAGLGFLFGLPRARFADADRGAGASNPNAVDAGQTAGAQRSAQYLTNSNLIKVSDWLTTIIIGVGLVNLAKLGPAAGKFSEALEEPLGGAPYAGVIGVTVIIIALLASLILCYLWTSIRVRELLEESENPPQPEPPSPPELTAGDASSGSASTTLSASTPTSAGVPASSHSSETASPDPSIPG